VTPVVEARAVTRSYGDLVAVRGVSLAAAPGESVALVGPSGSGKTTLLSMLGLLDRPTRGAVLVDGVDAATLSAAARARLRATRIGFVLQQNNLLPFLDVRDNVALPAWHAGASRRDALAAADALLARVGLTGRARAPAAQLSVGEAQRAAIARALVARPGIVLADEPTGSLDAAAADAVLAAFDEVRAAGAALVVVTHDPRVAARAGRVVTLPAPGAHLSAAAPPRSGSPPG
jgi:putative ABC transport system ATP-binding protein